jgi:hypothetical protein
MRPPLKHMFSQKELLLDKIYIYVYIHADAYLYVYIYICIHHIISLLFVLQIKMRPPLQHMFSQKELLLDSLYILTDIHIYYGKLYIFIYTTCFIDKDEAPFEAYVQSKRVAIGCSRYGVGESEMVRGSAISRL